VEDEVSNKTVELMHASLDAARTAMQSGDCAWLYARAVTQAGDAAQLSLTLERQGAELREVSEARDAFLARAQKAETDVIGMAAAIADELRGLRQRAEKAETRLEKMRLDNALPEIMHRFSPLWRCTACGEFYGDGQSCSSWRWTGDAMEHYCDHHPQAGHFPARKVTPDALAAAFRLADEKGRAP
jgi:uncharacterized protein with PIN domain